MSDTSRSNATLIAVFILPFILYVALLPAMPIMEPDEARYSLIPYEMNTRGDYITPHLKGVDYFEKPPLCYWATAMAFKAFGETPFASRLFVGLCAWGCVLLAYRMGLRLHDWMTGISSAAILSTSLLPFFMGRVHVLDMPLSFFVALATWSGFRFLTDQTRRKYWLYLLYGASALAFLTKGLIGIVFPFAILFLWLCLLRRWRDIPRLVSPVGIVIMLAVAGPWLVLVQQANPDFFRFFFIQEHFLRYTTTMHARYQPLYYFIPIAIAGIVPWLGFLPAALRGVKAERTLFDRSEFIFLVTWAGFIFLFFSLSSSKLIPYITPIFLPLAIILGRVFRTYAALPRSDTPSSAWEWVPVTIQAVLIISLLFLPAFSRHHRIPLGQWWPWIAVPLAAQIMLVFIPRIQRTGTGWFAAIYLLSGLFLAGLVFPAGHYVAPFRSAYPVAQAITRYVSAGAELYQYKMCAYGIDFYTKRHTPVVDDFGELRFGISKLPLSEKARAFLSSTEFIRLYQSGKDLYCVTDDPDKLELLRKDITGLTILWRNESFYLLRLSHSAAG